MTTSSEFSESCQLDEDANSANHVLAGWWLSHPSEKYESVGMMEIPN